MFKKLKIKKKEKLASRTFTATNLRTSGMTARKRLNIQTPAVGRAKTVSEKIFTHQTKPEF